MTDECRDMRLMEGVAEVSFLTDIKVDFGLCFRDRRTSNSPRLNGKLMRVLA